DDLGQTADSLWLFDLGQKQRASGCDLTCFDQIFRALNEGECDPVHASFKCGVEVFPVLARQGTDRKIRIRKAYALAIRDLGTGNDGADDLATISLGRAQPQPAIINEQLMSGLDS